MVDLSNGEVPITANGKTYTLALKTKGLQAFQKHFSSPTQVADLDDLLLKASQGSLEHFTAMVWAACLKYQPTMTLDEAIDLIDDAGGVVGIWEQFNTLIASAYPDAADAKELKEGVKKRPRKARTMPGTGENSNSQPAASV